MSQEGAVHAAEGEKRGGLVNSTSLVLMCHVSNVATSAGDAADDHRDSRMSTEAATTDSSVGYWCWSSRKNFMTQ